MKKVSKGHHSSLNELNITPLLDLAFVLLVIFIITTPQSSNDLEMNLPKPKNSQPVSPPKNKINRLLVDKDGRITLNDEGVELAALKQALVSLKAANPDVAVVLKGSAEVDYQHVVGVLDILNQTDVKVVLDTNTL